MVSALVSGSSGRGLSPGWGHCIVFLGKPRYSHSAALNPSVHTAVSRKVVQQNRTRQCRKVLWIVGVHGP